MGWWPFSFGADPDKSFFWAVNPSAIDRILPEETVDRTLVTSNLVPADRLKWMKDRPAADENLTDALIMSGALSEEALAQHPIHRMHIGLGASLAWASGEWTFKPHPQIQSERIDPDLIPRTNLLPCLWSGVKQYVSMEDILGAVSDPGLGKMLPLPSWLTRVQTLNQKEPRANWSKPSVMDVPWMNCSPAFRIQPEPWSSSSGS